MAYWWQYVRHQCRWSSVFGLVVPYQCLSVFNFRHEEWRFPLVTLHPSWAKMEVPQGCIVEPHPVFSYVEVAMMDDTHSGWWVVALTERVVETVALVMQETYEQYQMWPLSLLAVRFSRALDLVSVLGSQVNVNEYVDLVKVIESTCFAALMMAWCSRGTRAPDRSPGRVGPGADFVYYDPHLRQCVARSVAQAGAARVRRIVPEGHPLEYDFSAEAGGWGDSLQPPASAQKS